MHKHKITRIGCYLFFAIFMLLFTGLYSFAKAETVSSDKAEKAALAFIKSTHNVFPLTVSTQELSGFYELAEEETIIAYIAELEPTGFVIMSSDTNINPIIGYSGTANFDTTLSVQNHLYHFVKNDLSNRLKEVETHPESVIGTEQSNWDALLSDTAESLFDVETGPLLTTLWGQGDVNYEHVFNLYTPNNLWAGCVATAAAQCLKFYNWPPRGNGSHSYLLKPLDKTLAADFGSTTYLWDDMLDNYVTPDGSTPAQKEAVGLIMYHAGVAVNMFYGKNGSGAGLPSMAEAFENYFRTSGEYVWTVDPYFRDRLYSNIVQGRPVLLDVSVGSIGTHAIVADGVRHEKDDTKYYHLNFGWVGSSDSWYDIDGAISVSSDLLKSVYGAVMDIMPNPMMESESDRKETTGNYDVIWDVSDNLNADYFELTEGIETVLNYSDGAENGLDDWIIGGNWELSAERQVTGEKSFRAFSPYGGIFGTAKITSTVSYNVDEFTEISFYWMTSGFAGAKANFQVSTDGIYWDTLKMYKDENHDWSQENTIDLSDYYGEAIYVRFETDIYINSLGKITSDENGFYFDDFTIQNYNEVIWTSLNETVSGNSYNVSGKPDGKYHYRVRAFRDGRWWRWSDVMFLVVDTSTDVDKSNDKLSGFSLHQNFPNPFNSMTTIRYELPIDCHVELVVYDILGRKVAVLKDSMEHEGTHGVVWDGRDINGIDVGSGVYLYLLTAGEFLKRNSIVLIR